MHDSTLLTCDGCGQPATSVHLAKRFERLEWTTRYRPVHIGAVLLGAMAPAQDEDFLYSPSGEFSGEAGKVLEAAGISRIGKAVEATLVEFQRRGLFLTYVLECLLGPNGPVDLGSAVITDGDKLFSLDDGGTDLAIAELRRLLSGAGGAGLS